MMMLKRILTAWLCVSVWVSGEQAAPEPQLRIQPRPKQVEMNGEFTEVPRTVRIQVPAQPPAPIRYAANMLGTELEQRFSRKVGESAEGANRRASSAVLKLRLDPAVHLPPEGYELRISRTKGVLEMLVNGVDPSGVLYGSFTLLRIMAGSKDAVRIPCPAVIRDWPSLKTRAYTGFVRDLSESSLRTLDWLARWRINAGYYEIYADRGQDGVPPEVEELARAARARGLTIYGCVSNWRTDLYLKRPLCPSMRSDVALIERLFTELAERGCGGFIFLFDDLKQSSVEHPLKCAACRKRFGTLADVQAFWVQLMAKVGRRHGIERLLICPTPYYRAWKRSYQDKLDGVEYYRRLGPVCERLNVQMYFCPYRSRAIAEVTAAGLRNYVWWYNGVYSFERAAGRDRFPSGAWGGFQQFEFGWYNTRWDNRRGVVTLDDVAAETGSISARTRDAWLCAGGQVPWALWGAYAWAPEQFEPLAARPAAIESVLGTGSFPAYALWEKTVRHWMTAFACGTHRARWSDPSQRKALLSELARDIQSAEQAVLEITSSASSPAAEEMAAQYRPRLRGSVSWLKKKLAQGKEGRAEVRLNAMARRPEGNAVRWEQTMSLSNFGTLYGLRYAVEESAGVYGRCQWHFGSGLGMKAPSYRNWYDAGFIDLEVNGNSLDKQKATFTRQGPSGLAAEWDGEGATVTMRLSLRPDDGLAIRCEIAPKQEIESLDVKLWCIPGAGWGNWKDMDKWATTAVRDMQHPKQVKLDLAKERWVLFYDKTYDVPHDKAEGPCGLLFAPESLASAEIDLASYVVTTTLRVRPEVRAFELALWDSHGAKNADMVRAWRSSPPVLKK